MPPEHKKKMKLADIFMLVCMTLMVLACGFAIGAGYKQDKYEERIEWLSNKLEGWNSYLIEELNQLRIEYMQYGGKR